MIEARTQHDEGKEPREVVSPNSFVMFLESTKDLQTRFSQNKSEELSRIQGWKNSPSLYDISAQTAAIIARASEGPGYDSLLLAMQKIVDSDYFVSRGSINVDKNAKESLDATTKLIKKAYTAEEIKKLDELDELRKAHKRACVEDVAPLEAENKEITHEVSEAYKTFLLNGVEALEDMHGFFSGDIPPRVAEENRVALKIIADSEILHADKKASIDEVAIGLREVLQRDPDVKVFGKFLQSLSGKSGRVPEWIEYVKGILSTESDISLEDLAKKLVSAQPLPQELANDYKNFLYLYIQQLVAGIKSGLSPYKSRLKRVPTLIVPDLRTRKERPVEFTIIDETDEQRVEEGKPEYEILVNGNPYAEDMVNEFITKELGRNNRDVRLPADMKMFIDTLLHDPYGNTYKLKGMKVTIDGVSIPLRSFNPHDKNLHLSHPESSRYRVVYAIRRNKIHLIEIIHHDDYDKKYT